MSSVPEANSAYVLNYAEVVRRSAALIGTKQKESEAEKLCEERETMPVVLSQRDKGSVPEEDNVHKGNITSLGPSLSTLDGLASPQHTVPLAPEGVSAKPYIPSYLAALKTQSSTVMLEGVPVNVNKAQHQSHAEWCSSANFSNSLMEHETNSSWADDDEAFLESAARENKARLAGREAIKRQTQSPDYPNKDADTCSGSSSGRPRAGKGGGGYRDKSAKGVEQRNRAPCDLSSERHCSGNNPGTAKQQRSRGGDGGGTARDRFDILADMRSMRRF